MPYVKVKVKSKDVHVQDLQLLSHLDAFMRVGIHTAHQLTALQPHALRNVAQDAGLSEDQATIYPLQHVRYV